MLCPKCLCETRVIDTEGFNNQTRRRRECTKKTCRYRFNSIELSYELLQPLFKSAADLIVRTGILDPTNGGNVKKSKKSKNKQKIGGLFPTNRVEELNLTKK